MPKTLNEIEKEVDEVLQGIYDLMPMDDIVAQAIIEYAHEHKDKIALNIRYR
jgi:hypothetical protein